MNDKEFWDVVETSRDAINASRRDGNMKAQAARLEQLLLGLEPSEIVGFRDHFMEHFHRANRWDLWGVAYILAEGCSDDYFAYFRNWLISMGYAVYEAALETPESVEAASARPGVEDIFFEEFAYVVDDAYRKKAGHAIPPSTAHYASAPIGKQWRNEDELREMFPDLYQRQLG